MFCRTSRTCQNNLRGRILYTLPHPEQRRQKNSRPGSPAHNCITSESFFVSILGIGENRKPVTFRSGSACSGDQDDWQGFIAGQPVENIVIDISRIYSQERNRFRAFHNASSADGNDHVASVPFYICRSFLNCSCQRILGYFVKEQMGLTFCTAAS